jgi:hypothetical protein
MRIVKNYGSLPLTEQVDIAVDLGALPSSLQDILCLVSAKMVSTWGHAACEFIPLRMAVVISRLKQANSPPQTSVRHLG